MHADRLRELAAKAQAWTADGALEHARDALIGDTKTPEDLSAHLGYAPGEEKPAGQANHRNGATPKTVLTETGALPLEIPRDRDGSFRPQLVPTGVRRLLLFEANVLSLCARGVTVREIQAHLEQR